MNKEEALIEMLKGETVVDERGMSYWYSEHSNKIYSESTDGGDRIIVNLDLFLKPPIKHEYEIVKKEEFFYECMIQDDENECYLSASLINPETMRTLNKDDYSDKTIVQKLRKFDKNGRLVED